MTTMKAAPTPAGVATEQEIRSHFPAMMRRHPHKTGHPVAYLDGPGGTQVPDAVVQRMSEYLTCHNANTHWSYPTSEETDAQIWKVRQVLADFVNGKAEEIAFSANMTTLTFHLARALGRGWSDGDEVVVTELDHHANVAPWRALEKERGITVRTVRMRTSDGTLDFDHLRESLNPRTKLLAIGAASNALGTITDVRGAAAFAREHGALVFVDAVHYAPHVLTDVAALDADFLGCSAYKFYGPHVGVLWGRQELLVSLDVPKLEPAPNESPERLETGTQNHEGIVGAGAAVDYLASLAGPQLPRRKALELTFKALHSRSQELFDLLWSGLGELPKVTRFGLPPGEPRSPTLSFVVKGVKSTDVAISMANDGLFVSHGDFYAATVIDRLGVGPEGVVRIGCSAYTTREEIERAISALRRIAR